jgi:hypothetical protein
LIGTATDAGFRLDVNGTSRFQNNMNVTGSVTATSFTGSLLGTASLATTASNALTASFVQNAISASFASTASFVNPLRQDVQITGSLFVSSSNATQLQVGTSVLPYLFVSSSGAVQTTYQTTLATSIPDNVRVGTSVDSTTSPLYKLDVNGTVRSLGLFMTSSITNPGTSQLLSTSVTGSFTVITGSVIEFQVTNTGVRIGNATTDTHSVTGSLNVSGSITTTGTITAQTLVVQTVTSSVSFITGSTRFGSLLANTHQFTGSVSITGSLTTNGNSTTNGTSTLVGDVVFASNANSVSRMFYSSGSGLIIGTNASPAVPFAGTFLRIGAFDINGNISGIGSTSPIINVNNTNNGVGSQNTIQILENRSNFSFGNSILISGSSSNGSAQLQSGITISNIASHEYRAINITLASGSTSYGIYAGSGVRNYFSGSVSVGKIVPNAILDVNGSTIITGSLTVFTGSAIELQVTNTGVRIGNAITDTHNVTGSLGISGSVTATSFTGSLSGSATSATSASFASTASFVQTAQTASYVLNAVSASFASTSSFINTLNQPVIISGSFTVITGSAVEFQVTNTGVRIGNASTDVHTVTGSFNISGSGFVHGGGFIVSGTLATSGSTSQGLVAPLKFTTATANTNYTLVYTDEGKMVEMSNIADAPLLVTIPLNSSVPFPIGTEISIIQIGGGTTIITGSSGVTVYSSLGVKTLQNPYDVASVVKRGTDSWYLFGNLS